MCPTSHSWPEGSTSFFRRTKMKMRKRTKAEIAEDRAFLERMQANIDRTRRLAEKAQAELDAKRDGEQQAS
jgi:hypothetical protein